MRGLAILIAVFVLSSCDETARSHYATMEEARAQGAVDHGWIPSNLPSSAREIQEAHDLDTNVLWGAFCFDPSEANLFLSGLTPIERNAISYMRILDHSCENITAQNGFQFFASNKVVFAINGREGRGYFWNFWK